ncbi:DNA recombination protein RmuC [Mangrovimicrobium sediminis]|uniref:DNA recombination protein RmuC n=1 Tax=Mangrovimicrobium sediminis TaxID=2562682 RepID=UPI0019825319|nr:DNA recombination protein RmuC [Haliea sp. SAOS-164]
MIDIAWQELAIPGAAALGGLLLGVLVTLIIAQRQQRRTQHAFDEERRVLEQSVADAHREISSLLAARDGLSARLEEKLRDNDRLDGELRQQNARYQDLRSQHARLETQLSERQEQHEQQVALLKEARDNLKQEFEVLANRIFEDKGKHFTATSRESLESLLKPFREQITGFQSRINEVHSESIKGQVTLEGEIRKVLDIGLAMNTQAANLASALKGDKKTAGNWGEAQLERTLELAGLLPGDHYSAQESFTDDSGKRRMPDFVIKLPDNKSLVIDSKVSLVDYDRAIAAESDEARVEALAAHAAAVRRHIEDLAAKDYSNLPGLESPDFVLMFMPIEPAYIEALKLNRDLFNYGYQRGVVMVSHTTLMPILRTVANLWRIDQSNREAREISARAGEIYNQVCLVAERLQRLGATLQTTVKHYNLTLTGLAGQQGLAGKVERFRQLSSKASKQMAELEPIHADIELERLQAFELAEPEEGVEEDDLDVQPGDQEAQSGERSD